jgi:hypothetical protein
MRWERHDETLCTAHARRIPAARVTDTSRALLVWSPSQPLLRDRGSVKPGYAMPHRLAPFGEPRNGLSIAIEYVA